jgi:hypothetical protein
MTTDSESSQSEKEEEKSGQQSDSKKSGQKYKTNKTSAISDSLDEINEANSLTSDQTDDLTEAVDDVTMRNIHESSIKDVGHPLLEDLHTDDLEVQAEGSPIFEIEEERQTKSTSESVCDNGTIESELVPTDPSILVAKEVLVVEYSRSNKSGPQEQANEEPVGSDSRVPAGLEASGVTQSKKPEDDVAEDNEEQYTGENVNELNVEYILEQEVEYIPANDDDDENHGNPDENAEVILYDHLNCFVQVKEQNEVGPLTGKKQRSRRKTVLNAIDNDDPLEIQFGATPEPGTRRSSRRKRSSLESLGSNSKRRWSSLVNAESSSGFVENLGKLISSCKMQRKQLNVMKFQTA